MGEGYIKYDLVIAGGGPGGMAAALAAYESGIRSIIILEREEKLGGILNQCIHTGFGLTRFGEELTGPEYALKYIKMIHEKNIEYLTSATVLRITPDKKVRATSPEKGIFTIEARAVILSMGCRERPRGAMNIPGTRPAGIYTAGTAQKFVNVMGYMPGKEVVILGSGDIGLIMARRMTLEGARVRAVCEIMPYSGGLPRNIEQCLNDFGIPLMLCHTVTKIHGKERLTGVTVSETEEAEGKMVVKKGTEKFIPCDTLLLSVGLIPENELSRGLGLTIDPVTKGPVVSETGETQIPGIFACGNVQQVHGLVDNVSVHGEIAGHAAACSIKGIPYEGRTLRSTAEKKTRYVPAVISEGEWDITCTVCPKGCRIRARKNDIGSYDITGNSCCRGKEYALSEVTDPRRTLTTTIRCEDGSVIPVKTDRPIKKCDILKCMETINESVACKDAVSGDIIIHDICGTGADLISAANG